MQFMALSAGKNSVYLGTQDPDARAKDFLVEPGVRGATDLRAAKRWDKALTTYSAPYSE